MSSSKIILHVEDTFENRVLIRRLLMSEGYEVKDGRRIRRTCRRGRFRRID